MTVRRRRRLLVLPAPPPSYHAEMEIQRQAAVSRMRDFDSWPRPMRDLINGCKDVNLARDAYERGLRGSRAAEDLRARIGMLQAEEKAQRAPVEDLVAWASGDADS